MSTTFMASLGHVHPGQVRDAISANVHFSFNQHELQNRLPFSMKSHGFIHSRKSQALAAVQAN